MSEYPEYEQLMELRTEDRRRRAARTEDFEHYRQRVVVGFDGVSAGLLTFAQNINDARAAMAALVPHLPPSRASRRARGRRIARANAYIRRVERRRTNHRRAQRPVIKKGLTR